MSRLAIAGTALLLALAGAGCEAGKKLTDSLRNQANIALDRDNLPHLDTCETMNALDLDHNYRNCFLTDRSQIAVITDSRDKAVVDIRFQWVEP